MASQAHNGSVEICVTYAQKRTFIGTGVRVKKNEWNKAGFVCRRADAEDLNDMVNASIAESRITLTLAFLRFILLFLLSHGNNNNNSRTIN